MSKGWIGVDLDSTLAEYRGWRGTDHIGPPIRRMRVKVVEWMNGGHPEFPDAEVRIFTARLEDSHPAIRRWCIRHLGRELPITNVKDYACVRIYDDRARQVEENTGRIVGE